MPSPNECNATCHPSVVCDGVEEYKVENILDSQIFQGKLKYLIHWKGYRIEEDEWRPLEDVKGARRLITKFHRLNPKPPNISPPLTSLISLPPTDQLHTDPRYGPLWLGYGSIHIGIPCLWGGDECQGSFSLRLYLLSQGHIIWPKLTSFSWFHLSSNISLELCSGMFNHTWCSGCSSVWSLRITNALGNVPHCVSTVVYYKLRITTALVWLCVHILSTHPSRVPSGVSLRAGVALS